MEIKMSASEIHTLTVSMKLDETSSCETLRFEGNKIHSSPREQSLRYLLYIATKKTKHAPRFQGQHQATFNCTL